MDRVKQTNVIADINLPQFVKGFLYLFLGGRHRPVTSDKLPNRLQNRNDFTNYQIIESFDDELYRIRILKQ